MEKNYERKECFAFLKKNSLIYIYIYIYIIDYMINFDQRNKPVVFFQFLPVPHK